MKAIGNQNQTKAVLLCNNRLVREDNKPRRVTPSVFTQEILQSTEERLSNSTEVRPPRVLEWLDIGGASHHKLSVVDLDQPLFQPYPSEVVFQNFLPAQTYSIPLLLLNNDKVSRRVKLEQQDSEYFHVDATKEGNKVAPGLSATFTVYFTPQENKDYHHSLVFSTERERFEIPVCAIGPRAILDFRDRIELPVCPVKGSTEKTHLVRNMGNSTANFQLLTQRPFSVMPTSGTLDMGESMQVTVAFNPMAAGDHQEDLLLHYHTGEDVYISLFGSCEELNVRLQPDSVLLKKTFISLASVCAVSLTNNSESPLRYCWITGSRQTGESLSSLRESSVLQDMEKFQCGSDPSAVLRSQELSSQTTDLLLQDFSHDCITVEPAEGLMWPNMTTHFRVIFKPQEAKLYQQTIYCDVTGRQSQLPLRIQGEGIGPELSLNYDMMNMKNVYIGSQEFYKVQLMNSGLIEAPFRWSTPDTTFGRCFSFQPGEGMVPPGADQTVEISFQSRSLGSFCEDLLLIVTGQPQPLVLNFRGCVVGPNFHFNVSEINFGDVAFGFPLTYICTLFNPSFVPMKFALRVLGDGLGSPSVTADQQVADETLKNWRGHATRELHTQPVEFTVSPATGSVRALSDVDIKVTLCSNTVGRYRLALVVDVEGVGEEVMTIPINARCVVPEVLLESPVLDFQGCFLNLVYEQRVRLTNRSDLPACYGILDQESEENPNLVLHSSVPRGLILPGSSEELPVLLLAKAVGRLHHSLRIAVLGSLQPPLEVRVSCVGRGPILHLHSSQLHFGRIPVLTDVAKTLQLLNQSPIAAHFTARMSQRRSWWRIEPSEGEVPPESQLELRIVAHLKDTLIFKDRLEIFVQDSQTLAVCLSAEGTGTTIVSDRPLGPSLDLGTHLSHGSCQYHFKLTNLGQRVQRLYWKAEDFPPSTKTRTGDSFSNQIVLPPISTPKQRKVLNSGAALPRKDRPVFSLSPPRLELFPGCSVDMLLTGSSDSTRVVRERLVCRGIIGQQGKLEKVMSVDVICHFVAPLLSISPKQLNFFAKKVKGQNLPLVYKKLVLKNVSSLSLSMELTLAEPFYLCEASGEQSSATAKSLLLGDKSQVELWVCFNPDFYQDQMSRIVDEVLEIHHRGHPQEDMVALHAEVHYPNLHFSSTAVDFGCVVNCTETCREITITNCSQLPVSYCWAFTDDHKQREMMKEEEELKDSVSLPERRRSSSGTFSPASSSHSSLLSVGDQNRTAQCLRVQEIFDILPMYGDLQPGEKQQVAFSFYGHENISKEMVAQCRVDDGPTYELKLRGEASEISYRLQPTRLDFGLQLFHQVGEVEVNLSNTGRVGFKFQILYPEREEEDEGIDEAGGNTQEDGEQQIRPGRPVVIPSEGYIDGGAEQSLRVLFLPGVPVVFEKKLQLQAAFFPPEDITVTGVGLFPRISLNLPRNLSEESYGEVLDEARAAVEASRVRDELTDGDTPDGQSAETICTFTYEDLLHMEVERLLVKQNALSARNGQLGSGNPQCSSRKWYKLNKFPLPEYLLDFGFVIPNKVIVHTVRITNSGFIPVSFHADCKHLAGTGFSVEFERVKSLPCGETHTFSVKLDPLQSNIQAGDIEVVLPIQVSGGPLVQVRLCAVVIVPAVTVSTESLQFDTVQCGMCQMRTIQLLNQQPVPCQWSIAEEVKPFKKLDKFLPLYKRAELLQEQRAPPAVFEMIPCCGILTTGERVNVHVKFSPLEECSYSRRLLVGVADSSQQLFISAQGRGELPQLELDPAVLELGPCLPLSTDAEAEVILRNPSSFPLEVYILELDTLHVQEEKILSLLKGYDDNGLLLLPPRVPGEGLPVELLDYYQDLCSQLQDNAAPEGNMEDEPEKPKPSDTHLESSSMSTKPAETFIAELNRERDSGRLGELEMTPVCRAIARHMGVDLSSEGLAARNRRGIAVIMHGAPQTDGSGTVASLAHHYGSASLSVDAVIRDALIRGSSPVSTTARRLYQDAVQVIEDTTEAPATETTATEAPVTEPPETSDPNPEAPPLHTEPSEDSSRKQNLEAHLEEADPIVLRSLFPEQLLVDLLAERFQFGDCYRGLVIDGLDSAFTPSVANTLQVVLKALNNRKHIYVVRLSDSYQALKARERVQKEAGASCSTETAEGTEVTRSTEDDEAKKSKKMEEKESKEVLKKKKGPAGRKESMTLNSPQTSSPTDARKTQSSNQGASKLQQDKEAEEVKQPHTNSPPPEEQLDRETSQSCGDELQSLFRTYEQDLVQVDHILQCWDRVQGLLLAPFPTEEASEELQTEKLSPAGKKSKKGNNKVISPLSSQNAAAEVERPSPGDIIPHIVLSVTEMDCFNPEELVKSSCLPSLDEVLDDLGLGPSGPPIPPPVSFSIVPFPKHREPAQIQQTCFTFLVPLGPDEQDKEKKDSEDDLLASFGKEEAAGTGVSKSRIKGSMKEKDRKGRESHRSKSRTKPPEQPSSVLQTSTDCTEQVHHQAIVEKKRSQSLTAFRWVVPSGGEVVLKVWFYSESPGTFEQTFTLEVAGTQRQYQLTCRGISTYPSICKDHMTLFAHSKKVPQMKDDLLKSYVIKAQYFEFGPLLCSKTRDRYKEIPYPENTEKLVIHNDSGLQADVQFGFHHDTQASTFLLDPPTMSLQSGHKQELTVWAYPTKPGQVKDSIVCQIKDNPEVVIINISCLGVRPELLLETKQFHFDRVLVHRTDSRSVAMHNKTALPMSWRLQGVEELGDEFSVPQDQGIIAPNSSFHLKLHFRAKKPLHIRKVLRVEVSDVDNIVGIVHTENIQVLAEAYDMTFDILPDFLDFGTIKVFEEAKLSLKIKNRGKYEIAYKCVFEQNDASQPKLDSIFTASPQSGTLSAHERSTTVHVVCTPDREVSLREQPILAFQMIDPSIGSGGETITTLAIRVSVQAVFSRYKITPACDINFGPLVYGCWKSQNFTIENSGVFEVQFNICRMMSEPAAPRRTGGSSKLVPADSFSGKPAAAIRLRRKSIQRDTATPQSLLTMGVFKVSPCTGSLHPGAQQLITVDCTADQLGSWRQGLLIGISGRDPSDHPDGIPYILLAEVCRPGISLDMASIFEEHHLCHNSSQLASEQFINAEGIYVLDENKFVFNKVLVGRTVQARFKLTNNSKVPCVLNLAIKHGGSETPRNVESFDLFAPTLNIPSQSHGFAVVTFTPQTMQLYSAAFEATIEGSSWKVLDVELTGEGTLPSVCVLRPALRNSRGSPLMQFRRVLVGRRHTLPLVLLNDGNVPAQVHIDMLDENRVFSLKAAAGNTCSTITSTELQNATDSEHHLVHRVTLRLSVNQSVEFEVGLCSERPLSVKAEISLQVENNQYSNSTIQVTGEAYQEMVSLGNIRRSRRDVDQEEEEEGHCYTLDFGDCHVGGLHQESFTMTNHSSSQAVKFQWLPGGTQLAFSPQVGHLHAGCSKEVTATFASCQPLTLSRQSVKCKLCQVEFEQPLDEVADWDDRQKTVRWLSSRASQQAENNKEVKTDPEPSCSVVEGSQWELDLLISAVCDYAKFSCKTDDVHFKDTLLYQSRIHQLQMVNEGTVSLDFSWNIFLDSSCSQEDQRSGSSYSARPGSRSSLGSRPASTPRSAPRPCSALAGVMSLLTGAPEPVPFEVDPHMGSIEPGATQDFNLRFSPVHVAQFQGRVLCSIPNLQDGEQPPCVLVSGRSLLPHCHFDLEDSDYLSGNRRPPEFRAPLDPNTRVLELCAVGVSAPSTRRFRVLNPTSKPFSFKWRCEGRGDGPFSCLTPCGTVSPGKKEEVCFQYLAEQKDVVESAWSFMTETLSVPFLCVGTMREPLVYLDRVHLQFGEVLVGCKVEQLVDVVNKEEDWFQFLVLQSSLLSEDQQSSLSVQPMSGRLAPNQRLPLTVSFTPSREGNPSFRLILRVKRKSEPLTLSVKADCFTMRASLRVDKSDGGFEEVDPDHQDTLDFGQVGVSEQKSFSLLISNLARSVLEVTFDLSAPREMLRHVEVKPQSATVEVGQQLQATLSFCPRGSCSLQDVTLSVRVKHGSTFSFAVRGSAVAPSVEFSFSKLNFGKCFLICPGVTPPRQTLLITNRGQRGISVQCQFENTAFLEMDFHPDVLSPGAVMDVPITFCPPEARRYHQTLCFIINGCVTKEVEVLGQGVEMKLEVEEPRQRKLKLGTLTVGQKVKKQLVLINRSSLDLSFSLMLTASSPLDPKDLSVSPAGQLKLRPAARCIVDLQFSPQQPIPPFAAELQAECSGLIQDLLTVHGCCQGVEVFLDQNHLSFGAVVQRSKSQRKILLINMGDIGARFKWRCEDFPAELSITPATGYIGPGVELSLTVTFAPVELSNDARYEQLSCCVDGLSSHLSLTVTGSCIAASTTQEVVTFTCPVRSSHTQVLTVINPMNQPCSVQPVIEGEQWSTALSVAFDPHQNKTLEVTYRPLTMTTNGKKHLGSIFFSFPDGSGMLYALQGIAEPPKEENTVIRELPAKTQHEELLPVHNWLSRRQRFRVLIEAVKPDRLDATVSLSGLGYIDVPASSSKDYKLCFHTYREGQFHAKVTFRNEDTGEFCFYLVTFKASSPGVLSTVTLEAAVRRTASASVELENPLSTAADLTIHCRCSDINAPAQLTVPGRSKGVLTFEYHPLLAGESTAHLTVSSHDLGSFHYKLQLRALPPPPEKTVHFSTTLGSSHCVLIRFNNSRFKTKYSYKVDGAEFTVDKKVRALLEALAGSEVTVEVCFEPHQLGESRGQLTLSSKVGGQYVFPLHGLCLPPKAQGPFSIRTGCSISIPFKNVFLQTAAFSCQVDNPCFSVDGVDRIASKKTQDIQVSFQAPPGGTEGPWFGRLTICSQRSEGHSKTCSWVYYLKGHRPGSA